MIKVKGTKISLTGMDRIMLIHESKRLGMSPHDVITGCLWECVMRKARKGTFKNAKKEKR